MEPGGRTLRRGAQGWRSCLALFAALALLATLAAPASAASGTITPPHSDYGLDTDGDGLYNYLVVNVSLDITVGGAFLLVGNLYNLSAVFIASASASPTLSPGAQVVPLQFDGFEISKSNKDGPYYVDLALFDTSPTLLDTDLWTSAYYDSEDFESSPGYLFPPHSETPVDGDGNGKYDVLAVDVRVWVNVTIDMRVDGNLMDGSETTVIDSASVRDTRGPGLQVLRLEFAGFRIYASGKNGPYHVKLWLYNSGGSLLSKGLHVTGAYAYSAFEPPGATFSGPHADRGWDVELNGKFDYLVLDVALSVAEAGLYTIGGELEDDATEPTFITSNRNTTYLAVGTRHVDLHFLGGDLRDSGISGRYVARLEVVGDLGKPMATDTYTTGNYPPNPGFDERPAWFLPTLNDYGLDTGGTSVYEHLVVDARLNVRFAFPQDVLGDLWNAAGTVRIDSTENATTVAAGTRVLPLWFDGRAIYDAGLDGPYVARLDAYDPFGNFLNDTEHTTHPYACTEFGTPPDTTPPTIADVRVEPNPQELGGSTNVSAAITDGTAVAGAWLDVVGIGNYSMAHDAAGGPYYAARAYPVGTHAFTIWAVDTSGNGAAAAGTFRVLDTTKPSIVGLLVDPDPQQVGGSVNVSAVLSDLDGIASAFLDVVGVANASLAFDAGTGRHYLARAYARGTFPFILWVLDPSGNTNAASGDIHVIDTVAPDIADVRADPDPQEVHGVVNVSAVVTDADGVDFVNLDVSGFPTSPMARDAASGRYFLARTYDDLGTFDFTVWARDLTGNTGNIGGQFEIRDSTAPAIADVTADPSLAQPMEVVNLSAVVTDNHLLSEVRIRVLDPGGGTLEDRAMDHDGGTGRYFFARAYTQDGVHTFEITATDLSGNAAQAGGQFAISASGDLTPPSFVTHGASPDRQEVNLAVVLYATVQDDVGVAFVAANVTSPSGADLGNGTMSLDGGTYTRTGAYGELGLHAYCLWAEDFSGKGAKACGSFAIVDTTPPTVSATASPSPQTVHLEVNVTASVLDNHVVDRVEVEVRDPAGASLGTFPMAYDAGTSTYWYSRAYADLGLHAFTVRAWDAAGNPGTRDGSFRMDDPVPPAADAGPDQEALVGEAVTLDGSLSSDNDAITNYTWAFADGPTGRLLYGEVVVTAFQNPGSVVVTLSVRDRAGNVGVDTALVDVSAPPVTPPRPPSNVQVVVVGTDALQVSWSPPTQREDGSALDGLAGFDVYRSESAGPPYAKLNPTRWTSTSYLDTSIARGVTYHYSVKAIDSQGLESAFAVEATGLIESPGSIRGEVVLEDGTSPAVEALVVLYSGPAVVDNTMTDVQGAFEFPSVEPGAYRIRFTLSGYSAKTIEGIHVISGVPTDLGQVQLERDEGPIQGGGEGALWLAVALVVVAVSVLAVVLLLNHRRRRKRTSKSSLPRRDPSLEYTPYEGARRR